MGEPAFKLKGMIWQEGIEVRSSNYELYGSMSRRFVQTVATVVPQLYQYSRGGVLRSPGDDSGLARDGCPTPFKGFEMDGHGFRSWRWSQCNFGQT